MLTDDKLNRGLEALVRGEWEESRRLLEESIKLKETADAYEAAAWAYWWLNDSAAVFDYREKAYTLFLNENNNIAASRMASWIGVDYLEFKGELAIASGWFQRAEKLLEGFENTPELALIKILKGRLAYMVDKNVELALNLTEESLEISKSLKSVEGEMIAEAFKGFLLVTLGNISEGMPLLDDATVMALTAETSDVNMIVNTCCFLIDACQRVRDFERAGQWCIKVKEICQKWRYKAMFASCRTQYASVLVWRGDWKEAEEELLASAGELKQFRPLQVNSSLVRLADLRRKQGRWEEAEQLLNEVQSHWLKPIVSALLSYDKGDYETALSLAERVLRKIPDSEKTERIEGLELLVRANVKLGRMDEAHTALSELKIIESSIHTMPFKAALLSAEGIFNYASENYESARQSLEDAVDLYDKINLPYEASSNRLILAEVLVKMEQTTQAEAELHNAKTAFKKLGAEKDVIRTVNKLKRLPVVFTEGSSVSYEFTRREREVLKMISEGRNNEEIAEKLFISSRTVEKHLTNIYQKLGVSGKSARAFIVSYAIKHNLID
jgi:LuxR family transcriptional regulator, maltose regulon positive regulatory protein